MAKEVWQEGTRKKTSVVATQLWNSLPREARLALTLPVFCRLAKTELFHQAFLQLQLLLPPGDEGGGCFRGVQLGCVMFLLFICDDC